MIFVNTEKGTGIYHLFFSVFTASESEHFSHVSIVRPSLCPSVVIDARLAVIVHLLYDMHIAQFCMTLV